jgi:hypothetical protein
MDSTKMNTRPNRPFRAALAAFSLAGALSISAASAQERGFALNRMHASDRGSDWFTTESLDLRGHLRGAAGIVNDGSYRPLAIYNDDGTVRSAIVHDQIVTQVGGSLNLQDRFRVSMSLPVVIFQGGSGGTLAGETYEPPRSQSVGDLRLGGDVRLYGKYGDMATVAFGLRAFLPTGSRRDYTGDGTVRLHPRMLVAGDVEMFTYSGQLGFHYRPLDARVGESTLGSELTFGGAAGVRLLNRALTIGPEVYGGSVVLGDSAFSRRLTHIDVLLGLHHATGQFRIGAGVGTGLISGLGSATARWAISIEWQPDASKTGGTTSTSVAGR